MYFREMAAYLTIELNRENAQQQETGGTGIVDHWQQEQSYFYQATSRPDRYYDYWYENSGEPMPDWVGRPYIYNSGSWLAESYHASIPYRWNQREPYNNKCPLFKTSWLSKGTRAPIGCVALAMGTIMAYQ